MEHQINDGSGHSPSRMLLPDVCVKTENIIVKQEEIQFEEECMESKFDIETWKRKDPLQIKIKCNFIKSEEHDQRSKVSISGFHTGTEETIKQENDEYEDECMKSKFTLEPLKESDEHEVKTEYIDTKWEDPDQRSRVPIFEFHTRTEETIKQVNNEYEDEFESEPLKESSNHEVKTECIDIKWEENDQSEMMIHENSFTHGTISKTYKCPYCEYEANHSPLLKTHMVRLHKNMWLDPGEKIKIKLIFSEPLTYKCDECDYETSYGRSLRKHQLTHKDPSQMPRYKCDQCSYEGKFGYYLKRHQLTHKNRLPVQESEMRMYKCDRCSFETKYKHYLTTHQLMHKDPSQIHMYKCDMCSYKSKFNAQLKMHQLKHKDPSEVQMYKCAKCSYETRYKRSLVAHQLVHKDPSQVQKYKCDQCSYEGKLRYHLKKHKLRRHKASLQLQMYKCGECGYVTKYEHCLIAHQVVHKDKCTNVKMHQLQH